MKRVEVEWVDSCFEAGWRSSREAIRGSEAPLDVHYSCGYLVHQDDASVTVALSYRPKSDGLDELVGDTIRIPYCSVLKIRNVR